MRDNENLTSLTIQDGHGTHQGAVDFPEVCADQCGELRTLIERKQRTTEAVSLDYLNTAITKLSVLACEHCVGPRQLKVGSWRGKSCPISGIVERTN